VPSSGLDSPIEIGKKSIVARSFSLTAVLTVSLFVASMGLAGSVGAHDGCLSNQLYGSDPNCKAHWQDSHMEYHWGDHIAQAHHDGHRDRFQSAITRWVNACCPDSPWHTHFNTAADTHPNMVNSSGGTLGVGRVAQEDANHHIPRMIALWLRHDIGELSCSGDPCSWYTGTGDPGNKKIDAWSVWQEETGHAQNISHHGTSCTQTMSGSTCAGNTDKRSLSDHNKFHACDPYRRVHNFC
jgi:hypothetical protein